MQESTSTAPAQGVAAHTGIDWADQKHDVILKVDLRLALCVNGRLTWPVVTASPR